ncbi:MAG: signal recognition particle protein [Bacillota bacterium]|nr:MAG: signal recognition particle protein [Bacillota bacterium]
MLERLSQRLQDAFRRLRGRGKLTEADVDEALRGLRMALLEADVNFRVVKTFIERVRERAVGQEVLRSLTPAQQVIKIVYEELARLMGGQAAHLATAPEPPTVILLCGLQGSGKTTTAAKLAAWLRRNGRRPLLVAADTQRPAAIDQLQVLGRQLDVPVFSRGTEPPPPEIARDGIREARRLGRDVVVVDTAGRLHIDDALMEELRQVHDAVSPQEVLLVVDAMTGQDAVNVAERFSAALPLTGIILTKLDGDARGGAALSLREVTGRPIKFVGVGERPEDLEPFHPERMASRILGMGDVLTLIEKAQQAAGEGQAQRLAQRLAEDRFDLEDFLEQLRQMRRMGPLDQILGMIPGLGGRRLQGLQVDEKALKRVEAIIQSMTPEERRNPDIINGSRRRRIARGSGTTVQDVNRLLKQFAETRKMIRRLVGPGGRGRRGLPRGLGNFPFLP